MLLSMNNEEVIQAIDSQIAKLQQARSLLVEAGDAPRRGPGRPRKGTVPAKATKTRRLSAEGRKRIAEAMKRRWAERKKAASKSA